MESPPPLLLLLSGVFAIICLVQAQDQQGICILIVYIPYSLMLLSLNHICYMLFDSHFCKYNLKFISLARVHQFGLRVTR